ncbi:MAG: hypothetical protein EAX95_05790 [Candidatus Thorarchaeota archaeon]|nr:hypothetical protein [Candidatus Thorarchaeota archaeon]
MRPEERFVVLCGQAGNYTEKITGVSLVDAYFGPERLAPDHQEKERNPDDLVHDIVALRDVISDEIQPELRRKYLEGELSSLEAAVRWMKTPDLPYNEIVRQIFHIDIKKFSEAEIQRLRQELEDAMSGFPGNDLQEKVHLFRTEGEVSGQALENLIHGELQEKTKDVSMLFETRVYSKMGKMVTDNGVVYRTVTNKPWSGYNYYQGGYRSVNEFNTDQTFNRTTLLNTIYHEYEHHVSNLWRELAYRENNWVDLSVVPLSGRCVISEGTADTAKEFLDILDDTQSTRVWNLLYMLGRMTSINSAIMLNQEGSSIEDVVDYLVEKSFRTPKNATASLNFTRPRQENGKVNFWAPYIFTYFYGRAYYVLPFFERAKEEGALDEFFRTVYLNPYSGSSITWKEAFSWL